MRISVKGNYRKGKIEFLELENTVVEINIFLGLTSDKSRQKKELLEF